VRYSDGLKLKQEDEFELPVGLSFDIICAYALSSWVWRLL
jgi:hypothetical protein